jgi:hypothetical protein
MNEPIHIISLGAGVQSSTMALMAAKGEITPMPAAAIFADTQDEPKAVYEYLEYLSPLLPFPIVRVTNGRLSQTFGEKFVHLPTYRLKRSGKVSMGKKQCTKHFKLKPIYKYLRSVLRADKKRPVVMWVGITTDEISRVKPARVKYVLNRWPFIEKEMSRIACLYWLDKNNYETPPKSACEFCPLHSDATWRALSPSSMRRVVKIDKFFTAKRGEYLHPTCKPLSEIDFRTEEQRGQTNMFNNECEGMCGV